MDYKSFSQICYFAIDNIEFSQIFFRQKFEILTLTARKQAATSSNSYMERVSHLKSNLNVTENTMIGKSHHCD